MIDEGDLAKIIEDNYDSWVRWLTIRYPQVARDAVHEVYLKLKERPIKRALVEDPKGYLRIAFLNAARDLTYRSWWGKRVLVDSEVARNLMEDPTSPADPLVPPTYAPELVEAYRALTPLQQDVLEMRVIDDMSVQEIAAALDLSPDQIERALTAARKRLRLAITNSHRDDNA